MGKTKVMLLGPPGAGKGTQAQRMVERFKLVHLSTGDILRDEVKRGTALGQEAKTFMDGGELVPDQLIIDMVSGRIRKAGDGFLLDGFPRTVIQAEELAKITPLDVVINVALSRKEVVERLTSRRVCRACGAIYNLSFRPPADPTKCEACGGVLYQRDDDREEVIQNRYDVYQRQTEPLIEFYRGKGILRDVDGSLGSDAVFEEVTQIVEG